MSLLYQSGVNAVPVMTAVGNQSTQEETPKTLTLVATDADQDVLAYSATVNSGNVSTSITGAQLTLTPEDDWNGTATITVNVTDGKGGTDSDTFDLVVDPVNDLPTSAAGQVTATEDTVYTFAVADFPYTDIESDPLAKIRLQPVSAGQLWVDADADGTINNAEAPVAANDEVLTANIPQLKFLAAPEANGVAYATVGFEVNDGTDFGAAQTLTIDVTAVNDAPATSDNSVSTPEETVYAFKISDFPYNDVESDPITKIRLQPATAGLLWIDEDNSFIQDGGELEVTVNDEITAAEISKLKFLPSTGASGSAYLPPCKR